MTPVEHYKWEIRGAIVRHLYEAHTKEMDEQLAVIINANCSVMNYSHPSFGFNGRFYTMSSTNGPLIHQKLHPFLENKMREYEHQLYYADKLERARIEGYVNSVTSISDLPGDYLLLLPSALHAVVQGLITCDWSTSLSPEKIASFMAKYQSGYDAVRQRLALNLIL